MPILDYGLGCLYPLYSENNLKKLEIAYKKVIKTAGNLPRSFPTADLYEMLDEVSFRERAKTNFKSHLERIATLHNNLTGIDNAVPRLRNSVLTPPPH